MTAFAEFRADVKVVEKNSRLADESGKRAVINRVACSRVVHARQQRHGDRVFAKQRLTQRIGGDFHFVGEMLKLRQLVDHGQEDGHIRFGGRVDGERDHFMFYWMSSKFSSGHSRSLWSSSASFIFSMSRNAPM